MNTSLVGSSDNLSHAVNSGISSFDLDFPALANRGAPSSSSPSNSQSSSLPARTGYGEIEILALFYPVSHLFDRVRQEQVSLTANMTSCS